MDTELSAPACSRPSTQLIRSTSFASLGCRPYIITPFCLFLFPSPVAQVRLEWSLHAPVCFLLSARPPPPALRSFCVSPSSWPSRARSLSSASRCSVFDWFSLPPCPSPPTTPLFHSLGLVSSSLLSPLSYLPLLFPPLTHSMVSLTFANFFSRCWF